MFCIAAAWRLLHRPGLYGVLHRRQKPCARCPHIYEILISYLQMNAGLWARCEPPSWAKTPMAGTPGAAGQAWSGIAPDTAGPLGQAGHGTVRPAPKPALPPSTVTEPAHRFQPDPPPDLPIETADRFRSLADNSPDMIVRYDRALRRTYVNPAWEAVTGIPAAAALNFSPAERPGLMAVNSSEYERRLREVIDTGESIHMEVIQHRVDGAEIHLERRIVPELDGTGKVVSLLSISRDISERKKAQEEIVHLAFYDALTKLPNRRLLHNRIQAALDQSGRTGLLGAVLFIDMDRFKQINDSFGHNFGDLMLMEVANRIRASVRDADTVARLGGDEFVVLLEGIGTQKEWVSQHVDEVADRIRHALAMPYLLDSRLHRSSPSIGICLFDGIGQGVDTLLKQADVAMYQAKDAGRNAVRFYDPVMQEAVEARTALEYDLRQAVENDQFMLHYQVQVDAADRPIGVEALIRWQHPVRGVVSPAEFIGVAEESSLILDIGHWVLKAACQQLAAWAQNELTRGLSLSINVSAKQFRQPDFVTGTLDLLRAHQIEPSRLKLELTEGLMLDSVADATEKMHALKALGVKLSLDDFGTGYSSLSYLKRLPLDQIKIDQSFVRNVTVEPRDAILVRTIIVMARNFGLEVIAEGVETQAQKAFLRRHGCLAYQGYLFSKPLPPGPLLALLKQLTARSDPGQGVSGPVASPATGSGGAAQVAAWRFAC